ncbi:berberine bridge enzyme-like 22 [Vicia villosa]|uniref:berberine bridge enzyme-like 22 n=1 Tax=Vicia villosa TaxID=3911 RepID=UPI00273A8213|nr:berberine bridge enzyme-like 22 [Vicia villosa]
MKVDMETKTTWVEGGATLEETYYAISQASDVYGFSAGSCPTVGVGGHIGGGGFGLLSRKYESLDMYAVARRKREVNRGLLEEKAALASAESHRYVETRKPVPDPQVTGLIYGNKNKESSNRTHD